ncbi:DUF3152 domain-containing protein [Streptomyces sp. NBC_01754]|uniref:DUF3152 domain-containing protein n=1 Tax=Streptomyces sp. NBC_01754 TaxID=2975930 RepID=UPI002DDBD8B3|nr:DUF3152 domain-containing protein [Streptomyces sp. NBC_01754]WSC94698.1 DUF3152 domain-containing protein [Streptomyces sp. NBC_01754]
MGRHSRKGLEATGREAEAGGEGVVGGPGRGRRRRESATPHAGDGPTPFHDAPRVRGGHPEQHEPGGGWGSGPQFRYDGVQGQAGRSQEAYVQQAAARQLTAQQAARHAATGRTEAPGPTDGGPLIPGPRREFIEAFDTGPSFPAQAPRREEAPEGAPGAAADPDGGDGAGTTRDAKGGKGRTFTGIAAAAVTTVLAVVVAGQVARDSPDASGPPLAAGVDRDEPEDVSRRDERPAPEARHAEARPLSYAQKMALPYSLAPDLTASGTFEAVPGMAKAPGTGRKYQYRIDVEKGLGLDTELFAEAVQKTLNDDRSWAHKGAMTFERVSSGEPEFVITLASPGTTALWCEKSGLDTTEDNVSCDSAATDRVMINAYRWAQGASTFGPDKLLIYRQMLINHEVGHRLGHNHESCRTPGSLAPVMQQQTKTLEIEGIRCLPNPWVHPGN